MNDNFQKCLDLVLKSEGGYVNDPRDHGGETMMGVTKNAWSTWIKRPINDGEMARLTKEDITPFYKALYFDKAYCPDLPIGVDYLVFDAAVNMGVGQAVRLLQRALGVVADGAIGPNTLKAINEADAKELIQKFSDAKTTFYKGLGNFNVYGTGWLKRVADVQAVANKMLG